MEDQTTTASESQLGQMLGGWADAFDGLQVLFVTYAFSVIGAILILSPRLLYQADLCRLGGIPDQQMGGMIMLAIGTPVYLIASLVLLSKELRSNRNGELTP